MNETRIRIWEDASLEMEAVLKVRTPALTRSLFNLGWSDWSDPISYDLKYGIVAAMVEELGQDEDFLSIYPHSEPVAFADGRSDDVHGGFGVLWPIL